MSLKLRINSNQKPVATPGFTILELLVVIVVIGILAAITIISYLGIQQKAISASLQSDLKNASTQLGVDSALNGAYPDSPGSADSGEGLGGSDDTVYQYTLTSSGYCLSATSLSSDSLAFHISSGDGTILSGVCSGHAMPGAAVGLTCQDGFIPIPGNELFATSDFCTMKYEAKNVAGVATSQAAGLPWTDIDQFNAISASQNACSGCHLITESEWLTIAHNVASVGSNWSGGSVGSGYLYSGHNDGVPDASLAADSNDANGYSGTGQSGTSNQRRTLELTNGEIIWDISGNVYNWTAGQTAGGQPGATGVSYFAWRQWNTASITGTLSPSPFPSYGTPAAGSWDSNQGVGQVWSNASDTVLRGFRRGGDWGRKQYAGVFSLFLNGAPGNQDTNIGFRVSK